MGWQHKQFNAGTQHLFNQILLIADLPCAPALLWKGVSFGEQQQGLVFIIISPAINTEFSPGVFLPLNQLATTSAVVTRGGRHTATESQQHKFSQVSLRDPLTICEVMQYCQCIGW